ncbi:MAG: hypothetical protein V9F82_04480 [Dermatophilaceae bacterium]
MDHAKHLRDAISDLRRRRDSIDRAISLMEEILTTIYGETIVNATAAPAVAFKAAASGEEPSEARSDRVRRIFEDDTEGRVWTAERLAVEVGEVPSEAILRAVAAIVSRLARAGVIVRIGRGQYRSANASAPAATGAEETEESSEDSSLKEGGADHDSAPPHDREDLAEAPDVHDPVGDRASIEGGSVIGLAASRSSD